MSTTLSHTGGLEEAAEAYPLPSLRRIALAAVLTVALGFGGLGTWAALTPLDSAVPASGAFIAAGKRKTVTLLSSGVLKALLVKEGDHVAAGQTLFLLDDVQTQAAAKQAEAQYWGAVARAARLEAEIADARSMTLPDDLLAAAGQDPAIAAMLSAERALFATRWSAFDGTARITARKVQQLQTQVAALQSQIQSLQLRLGITLEEARGIATLQRDGFAPRTQLLEAQRAVSQAQSDLADAHGRMDGALSAIEQTKLELVNTVQTRHSDAARDLGEIKATLADVSQRLAATRDTLAHSVVSAPEAGAVTDIKFFTPGSSITAGQPVLDIVPADGRLLIEAGIQPTDIEHVHVGQRVNIKLSAYKAHRVPAVSGRLVYVGADRQENARGEPVFLVRAELSPDALAPYPGVTAYAGMPADILIVGGERTALDFIISPLADGMRGGMREE